MGKPKPLTYYTAREEWLNVASHGLGFVLSLVALPLLVIRAVNHGTAWHVVSFAVFPAFWYIRSRTPFAWRRLRFE